MFGKTCILPSNLHKLFVVIICAFMKTGRAKLSAITGMNVKVKEVRMKYLVICVDTNSRSMKGIILKTYFGIVTAAQDKTGIGWC